MNKSVKISIIVISALLIAFVVLLVINQSPNSQNSALNTSTTQTGSSISENTSSSEGTNEQTSTSNLNSTQSQPTQSVNGEYTNYSSDLVANTDKEKIVLFFYASWCPSCRAQDAKLEGDKNNVPANLLVLRTNYDEERELRIKYGVTMQHTFVQIDKQGNKLQSWPALYDSYNFTEIARKLI